MKRLFLAGFLSFLMLGWMSCSQQNQEGSSEESANATETTDAASDAAGLSMADGSYSIDASASEFNWIGKKVTGQHNGNVAIEKGKLMVESGSLAGGEFTIDMTTIEVEDLEEGTENYTKLMGHLRSNDFFSVDDHPKAMFKITSVSPAAEDAEGTHIITGDLTIKGKTNSIEFPATIEQVDGKMIANADFSFDRTRWDINFKSKTVFPDLADKFIYDDVEVSINLVAPTKQS